MKTEKPVFISCKMLFKGLIMNTNDAHAEQQHLTDGNSNLRAAHDNFCGSRQYQTGV